MRNAKCLQDGRRALDAVSLRQMREAVLNVLLDRQMREQGERLEYVADAPFANRKVIALR